MNSWISILPAISAPKNLSAFLGAISPIALLSFCCNLLASSGVSSVSSISDLSTGLMKRAKSSYLMAPTLSKSNAARKASISPFVITVWRMCSSTRMSFLSSSKSKELLRSVSAFLNSFSGDSEAIARLISLRRRFSTSSLRPVFRCRFSISSGGMKQDIPFEANSDKRSRDNSLLPCRSIARMKLSTSALLNKFRGNLNSTRMSF
mmetsp:Transcript_55854/g.133120  ORF Transcript_55854/g.133120 Transcript_55854/m.133120 type:complete len:206 (-) Transcript_55854:1556-2173(-)